MPLITFVHTADGHIDTFERLFEERGAGLRRRHIVRSDWLAEAIAAGVTESLRSRVADCLGEAARGSDLVVCSCSSLGPMVDALGAELPNVLRVDRPLMDKAASLGSTVVVALCLESSRQPSLDLLARSAAGTGTAVHAEVVMCRDAWPLFERNDIDGFARAVAGEVRNALPAIERPSCIALGQLSMAPAGRHLADLSIPVLTSPALAFEAILEAVQG